MLEYGMTGREGNSGEWIKRRLVIVLQKALVKVITNEDEVYIDRLAVKEVCTSVFTERYRGT